MTRVVELVVNAAKEGIAEQELQTALSELYGKPPEHFDKLIHQIFTVKQPYTLLKDIKEEVATKHQARLEKIGLECSLEISLALVPVGGEQTADGSAPSAPACPVCKEPTTSQEECTSCGVDLRKATSARQSSDAIQRTLENAQEELKKKKNQNAETLEKQRKEKLEKEKAAKEKIEAEKKAVEQKEEVKDVFTAEYVDPADEKKRKMVMGGAVAMVAAGVIAFGTGTFTSSPAVDTQAAGDLITADSESAADETAISADAETASGADSETGDTASAETGSDDTTASAATEPGDTTASGVTETGAPASAAALSENIVAAATEKVESGSPNGPVADNFDETIAKFENAAARQSDNRSAEQVAEDLIANATRNKAAFQKSASLTGAKGGTLQMPSSMNGNGAAGGANTASGIQQLEGAGSLNLNATLAKYSGNTNAAGGLSQGTGSGSYQDQFLDHWMSRQAKARKLGRLATKLMKQGQSEMAQQLVDETNDTWLAIHGHHKIAIAEQLAGDGDGSHDRMMNLFVDLMMVDDVAEKITALADHAQTWHLMLSDTQTDNTFDQMKSMAAAPMTPRQQIVANVAMAKSLQSTDRKSDSRKRFDKALDASLQIANKNNARDEMIHFIALAEATARFGDEALLHAGKIRNENLRQAAYQSLYQTFSKFGMDREASAALNKAGGADMPAVDRAALEKMLKNGPKLSELEQ